MRITFLPGAQTTPEHGAVVDMEPGAFLDDMCSTAGSKSRQCATKEDKLHGPGFVLAQYKPGARSKALTDLEPTSATEVLAYDVDDITRAQLDAVWPTWAQFDGGVYSTMKHTPTAPRVRLLVRLSRPVCNGSGDEYARVYHAVAVLLGIPFDTSTKDRARFFYGPQHMPGKLEEQWRFRFHGAVIPVEDVLAAVTAGELPSPTAGTTPNPNAAGPLRLPAKDKLKNLADKLLNSSVPDAVAVGSILEAVLGGRAYAEAGGIHVAGLHLSFALVRDVPLFDGAAFATTYLEPCWARMPGSNHDARTENWMAQIDSACAKLEHGRQEKAAAEASFTISTAPELTAEQLEAAGRLGGAFVCEFKGVYYVYDARRMQYVGPVKGTGLPAACRAGLVGVPGFEYQEFTKGKPTLKSGPRLVEEYGFALERVHYWAHPPAEKFDADSREVHIPAYTCNDWPAQYHQCADEMLRCVAGDQYERVEHLLAKFTDLRQPLPALVLVGPRGTWKSRIAQILSRYWGLRAAPTPCDATQVLGRFSRPLLGNPLVHTDEIMARAENGRAIPEIYRRSISSVVHEVEAKGVDPVTLHTALRHVIAVNDLGQVFGGEVDASSVEATVERYMVVRTTAPRVAAFEERWAGTAELEALREGGSLLEHVSWLTQTSTYTGTCRLWVDTGTDRDTLMRARFSDDSLSLLMNIGIAQLLAEAETSNPGAALGRLPLVCDEAGQLRFSPSRAVDNWPTSSLTVGCGVKKPTTQKAGQLLMKAGFKLEVDERAGNSRIWKAWKVDHSLLRAFLSCEDSHTWGELADACGRVWGVRPWDAP